MMKYATDVCEAPICSVSDSMQLNLNVTSPNRMSYKTINKARRVEADEWGVAQFISTAGLLAEA